MLSLSRRYMFQEFCAHLAKDELAKHLARLLFDGLSVEEANDEMGAVDTREILDRIHLAHVYVSTQYWRRVKRASVVYGKMRRGELTVMPDHVTNAPVLGEIQRLSRSKDERGFELLSEALGVQLPCIVNTLLGFEEKVERKPSIFQATLGI